MRHRNRVEVTVELVVHVPTQAETRDAFDCRAMWQLINRFEIVVWRTTRLGLSSQIWRDQVCRIARVKVGEFGGVTRREPRTVPRFQQLASAGHQDERIERGITCDRR